MRDECVIRFVGVRGGYKAMTGGVQVRDAYREEELKRARDDGGCRRGGSLEFLGSKTWWSVDNHTDRFIYIAIG